jgi:hypothetical protein
MAFGPALKRSPRRTSQHYAQTLSPVALILVLLKVALHTISKVLGYIHRLRHTPVSEIEDQAQELLKAIHDLRTNEVNQSLF